jgi:hypothetical protein
MRALAWRHSAAFRAGGASGTAEIRTGARRVQPPNMQNVMSGCTAETDEVLAPEAAVGRDAGRLGKTDLDRETHV